MRSELRRHLARGAALALLCAAPACRAQTDDVALKAAYIYNIAQFTVWPAGVATRPFHLCVDNGHALWDSLRRLQGRNVGERRVAVVTTPAPAVGPCDVAVLRAGAPRPLEDNSGTLTVVDEPGTGYNGAVALIEEDQHLRFDIDTKEAARAGLRFSSRLLRLARNVR